MAQRRRDLPPSVRDNAVGRCAGTTTPCLRGSSTPVRRRHAEDPGWESLAVSIPPGSVLRRACLHTPVRSTGSDRSAAELAKELPVLGVAQGEAKVRQILRGGGPFAEVWRGRWQAG
jgi:hypothetical protein